MRTLAEVGSVVVAAGRPRGPRRGHAPGAAQPNATGSVPGTLVANPAAGTIPGVGSGPVVTVTFTPAAATSSTTAIARLDVAAA